MRTIRYISVLLAGSMLLLHTLLPHEHHDTLNDGEHLYAQHQAATLFDLLQLAFHFDLGEGHLENFNVEQEFVLVALPGICSEILVEPPIVLEILALPTDFEILESPPDLFLRQPRFRGPPQIV